MLPFFPCFFQLLMRLLYVKHYMLLLAMQSETAVPMTGSRQGRNPVAALSVAYI